MSFIESDKDFQWLMKSINNIKDSNRDFRILLAEFINDLSSSNDDEYFFNSLPFLQFVNEGNDIIAYTKPDKFLYLNAPKGGGVGNNKAIWDFIYCHECLHQLWETFEVAETIKRKDGSYNHDVLNIASDCVINHYLRDMRHKKPFDKGIFPEVIKKEFNVEYDPKHDTQLTLYYKIMKSPVAQAMQKAQKLAQQMGKEGKGMQRNSGSSGQQQQSSGEGSGQQSSNINQNDIVDPGGTPKKGGQQQQNSPSGRAENAANKAQQSADNAQEAANKAKANGDGDANAKQNSADKAKKAAEKAKDAADKAKKAEDKGNMVEAEKQAKEAEKAASDAEQANKEAGGKPSNQQNTQQNNNNNSSKQAGNEYGNNEMTLDDMKRWHEDIIREARNKIVGTFGDFISKCKSSQKGETMTVKTTSGNASWNKEVDLEMKKIITQHVNRKKRELVPTYSRVKRGSGIVQMGMPIKPGVKIKEDKLNITFAFYVDRSGSMHNCINEVFKAVYSLSDGIFNKYRRERVVGEIIPTFFAFDYSLHKLKYGQKMPDSGGTMSLNDLVDNIKENTKEVMINLILTDGGFGDSTPEEVYKNLQNIDGNVIIICNEESAWNDLDDMAKKSKGRIISIHADHDFTVK